MSEVVRSVRNRFRTARNNPGVAEEWRRQEAERRRFGINPREPAALMSLEEGKKPLTGTGEHTLELITAYMEQFPIEALKAEIFRGYRKGSEEPRLTHEEIIQCLGRSVIELIQLLESTGFNLLREHIECDESVEELLKCARKLSSTPEQ